METFAPINLAIRSSWKHFSVFILSYTISTVLLTNTQLFDMLLVVP